jgi:hypothetical protein
VRIPGTGRISLLRDAGEIKQFRSLSYERSVPAAFMEASVWSTGPGHLPEEGITLRIAYLTTNGRAREGAGLVGQAW